jgi:hypothetical protein
MRRGAMRNVAKAQRCKNKTVVCCTARETAIASQRQIKEWIGREYGFVADRSQ